MGKIYIKDMDEEDISQVALLSGELFKREGWDREAFEKELDNPISRVRVIKDGFKIVGFYVAWIISDEIELASIAVHSEYRGKNFAQQLLDDLINYGIKFNSKIVFLEVRESNERAISFYKKNQFEYLSTRKNYYVDGENATIFQRKL
ncbi:ribosomal protein S18-alanine N-acetyltransferase [bacterium]|nr:ribosomal protein S18-alanine N-acetyltransferase [bacterium]